MSDEFDAVFRRIHERVRPSETEREALVSAAETLIQRAEDVIADLPVEASVVLAGSTTRQTWIAGDRDIDIFLRFPPTLDREALRTHGLTVGHAVLPESREEYAEHPYVVGEFRGFQVDIVPCYALDDATEIRSAVDRTPFHTEYVTEHITPELAGDVRVCKQFFTGIGVYGSNLRTEGFSGFLTELLIIEFGGFRPFIEAIADWHPPVRIDPCDHGTATFDDPLVLIDPTDPTRNVAAVLSAENLARTQHFARDLLADPREDLFVPPPVEPITAATARTRFGERDTTPIAIRLTAPAVVDDQLWPQLERSRSGIESALNRRGFDVLRSDAFAVEGTAEGRAVALLFELAVSTRPRVERHEGPPVHVREHATSFYETYVDADVAGPFIEDDRYVVERPREFTSARELLASDALFDIALGSDIKQALEDDYDVLVGPAVGELAESFGPQLARYLNPTPRG